MLIFLCTQVSDLTPLQGLTNLQSLDCFDTDVSDLAPLQGLSNLRSIDCSVTRVSDLGPLRGLTNLQYLDCSRTRVSNLAPLQGLTNLLSLNWSGTQESDLALLLGDSLRKRDCRKAWNMEVRDLTPLQGLTNLQRLDCSACRLTAVPGGFWFRESLKKLYLYQAQLPGIPPEVLSQGPSENCLDSLRAHLRDLETGREEVSDIKLMVLGNGRIGKTQICRRLRGETYDKNVESTHGILVTSAPLPGSHDSERLQIWDFGGQDIYHGTHALFLRSRAVFLLVWIKEAKARAEYSHGGILFRNQPLAYWLDYAKHFGGTESPALVIQTRCERPEDEILFPPVPDGSLAEFPFKKFLHYSAKNNRGRPSLDDALQQAAVWLRDHQGIAEIGSGRFRVKRRLEAMREEDAARPPSERQWRIIADDHFLQLCEEAGGISSPEHLLSYLHNAGTVFHRPGLFDDQIILDQGWALEQIYAVFHREKCVKKLNRQKGRFTRSDLGDWLWDAAGHSVGEQKLFLSMMESCGICFALRPAQPDKGIETEYIAPDFLPEKSEIAQDLALKWDADLPTESAEFDYSLLHPGLMRAIVSKIGSDAGLNGDYWRGGVFAYETGTGSRALIEEQVLEGWRGRIRVSTQRGQAALLLQRLTGLVEKEQSRMGLSPAVRRTMGTPGQISLKPGYAEIIVERASEPPPPLTFAQEPAAKPEYFVSYAWKDDTPGGKEREHIVDDLCTAAEENGITILRDRNVLGLGDRISKFMHLIGRGRGNRVFVVLSNKYLKSPYCMYELYELWVNCRQDDNEFLSHIRVYTLPDAEIWTPLERAECAEYWENEYVNLERKLKHLGESDFRKYRCMKSFSHHIGEILATVTDILQPRNFEELEKYGFSDIPGAGRASEV